MSDERRERERWGMEAARLQMKGGKTQEARESTCKHEESRKLPTGLSVMTLGKARSFESSGQSLKAISARYFRPRSRKENGATRAKGSNKAILTLCL